jgi:hypothetical protein
MRSAIATRLAALIAPVPTCLMLHIFGEIGAPLPDGAIGHFIGCQRPQLGVGGPVATEL